MACLFAWVLNHVWLFATPWTVVHQGPQSMGFSRQEYWSGLPCPPPEDCPWPRDRTCVSYVSGIVGFFTTGATREAHNTWVGDIKFYSKVIYSTLSFRILKSSNIISFCLGLRDSQYRPHDQIALKNLQSDVPEKRSDFTEVTYVSNS